MKKLIIKSVVYFVMILISLELIVRVFHLTKENPSRYIDEHNVEKWVPNQEGYSVTGNRKQNFSKFHINKSGFNSYREFTPTKDKIEIALVGDSYIQGFHQNYYNSIGKKIENKLGQDIEVYEYGYAGYDFADQLHLINKYKKHFDLINHVLIGLQFKSDLTRGEYHIIQDRMHLESPVYKNMQRIKLLVYTQNIGILEPLWKLAGILSSIGRKNKQNTQKIKTEKEIINIQEKFISNFENLVRLYGYDKDRFVLLIDKAMTPKLFLDYLVKNDYKFIDFSKALKESKLPTTLIYDRHWNNNGRDLVANEIVKYYNDIIK